MVVGGFEAQDEGTDDIASVACPDNDVLITRIVLGHQPVPSHVLGDLQIASGGPADGEEVCHQQARGQGHGEAEVAGSSGAAGPGELVEDGDGGQEAGEEDWVKDEAEGGALTLLRDGVGDELEGVNLVVAGGEDVEGEGWDVIHIGRGEEGGGWAVGIGDVPGQWRG